MEGVAGAPWPQTPLHCHPGRGWRWKLNIAVHLAPLPIVLTAVLLQYLLFAAVDWRLSPWIFIALVLAVAGANSLRNARRPLISFLDDALKYRPDPRWARTMTIPRDSITGFEPDGKYLTVRRFPTTLRLDLHHLSDTDRERIYDELDAGSSSVEST